MEVTKREILFSTIILTAMIGFGVLISEPIISSLTKRAIKITSSHQIKDPEKFGYLGRTEAGLFLAEGNLDAINPKTLPELRGRYLEIQKEKEKYTRHVEVYTTTDGKGHTTTHTRTYYSWDYMNREKWVCDSVVFMGKKFSLREVNFWYITKSDTTIYEKARGFWGPEVGDIRWVYYTWPSRTYGLLSGCAKEKWYKELSFRKGESIKEAVKRAERDIHVIPWVFWIFWILLTGGLIYGFYWLENEWLEDKKEKSRI